MRILFIDILPYVVVILVVVTLWVYLPRVPLDKRRTYLVWTSATTALLVVVALLWVWNLHYLIGKH